MNLRPSELVTIVLLTAACATQRESRISTAEARDRPTDEPCAAPKPPPPEPAPHEPDWAWRWVCGDWHWDGVRYVWREARYELRAR